VHEQAANDVPLFLALIGEEGAVHDMGAGGCSWQSDPSNNCTTNRDTWSRHKG
jgi:hypothetical protein